MGSKLKEGEDFYFENGFMVFTETYHRKRGYCCQNNCRHCPYRNDSGKKAEGAQPSGSPKGIL